MNDLGMVVDLAHASFQTTVDANFRPVLTEYRQFDDLDAGLSMRGLGTDDIDRVLGVNAVELIAAVCG